ncbi:MAG: helix-turn-helix transcriptional regulator [Paludibacteraceae bacterium]|nr:helix-turn-helix transcriptional regulator [Paludibacteraceae bacterium]
MYNGEQIRVLLAKQKKSQRDLAEYVTGNPNSSIHNLFKNPTVKTIEAVADFFKVTIDSLFMRAQEPINYTTETDMENAYLKKLIKYQETEMNAFRLLNDSNDYMLEQLKHRVAELESRLKYIQAHPEVIGELEPLPEFNLVVPFMQGVGDPKVYTNLTAAQKRQNKIHRKYVKKVIEPKIKKDLEDQGL